MQETRRIAPGLALSGLVAIAAVAVAPLAATVAQIPTMVIALFIGIALNRVARQPLFQPGIVFCLKHVLRWAVALLGLRIALGDVVSLGLATAALVAIAMMTTVAAGFLFARWLGLQAAFGALAGAGSAVCGASATLATSIVVPEYKDKQRDVIFVVIAVNALSTAAMVLYPLICTAFGLGEQATGIMLGATIHDVAQVVGAGYAISEPVGNTAVIVKLSRVFLLLPVVLSIGWVLARRAVAADVAKIPFPMFALVFVLLFAVNSIALSVPPIAALVPSIKAPFVTASTWGLLIAIGALGLGTSLSTVAAIGWRHIATVLGTTAVILVVVIAGVRLMP